MATVADGQSEAAAIIRSMVETVTVMPTVRGRAPGLRVEGDLARLANLGRPQMASVAGGRRCRVRGLNSRPTVYKTVQAL